MRIHIRDITGTPAPLPQYLRKRLRRGTRRPGPTPPLVAVDTGHQSEAIARHERVLARHTRRGAQPHPWHERRAMVIKRHAANILPVDVPHGFTQAWRPEDHSVAANEYAWLVATQWQELPPEYLLMRTNGLRGQSLDALVEFDDETYSVKDFVPDDGSYIPIYEMLHATELVGGMRRIEAFLKAEDERQWHTGWPHRYRAVAQDGVVGFVPVDRDLPAHVVRREVARLHPNRDVEAVISASAWRAAHLRSYSDDQGRRRWAFLDGTFRSRDDIPLKELYRLLDDIDAERDTLDTDHDEEEAEYNPNTACPNPNCRERGEDCRLCFGSGNVIHTLGMDAEADWPPPGWLPETHAFAWNRPAPRPMDLPF